MDEWKLVAANYGISNQATVDVMGKIIQHIVSNDGALHFPDGFDIGTYLAVDPKPYAAKTLRLEIEFAKETSKYHVPQIEEQRNPGSVPPA